MPAADAAPVTVELGALRANHNSVSFAYSNWTVRQKSASECLGTQWLGYSTTEPENKAGAQWYRVSHGAVFATGLCGGGNSSMYYLQSKIGVIGGAPTSADRRYTVRPRRDQSHQQPGVLKSGTTRRPT